MNQLIWWHQNLVLALFVLKFRMGHRLWFFQLSSDCSHQGCSRQSRLVSLLHLHFVPLFNKFLSRSKRVLFSKLFECISHGEQTQVLVLDIMLLVLLTVDVISAEAVAKSEVQLEEFTCWETKEENFWVLRSIVIWEGWRL